jgi:hypothetical protein
MPKSVKSRQNKNAVIMKRILRVSVWIALLSTCVMSCNQEDQNVSPVQDQEIGEIARIEKDKGIVFFKKDITFESNGNKAVLRIATQDETIFRNVVDNFEVIIKPIYSKDILATRGNGNSTTNESNLPSVGEEILTEFIEIEMKEKGLIGFTTSFHFKESKSKANGKVNLSGYGAYVTHYSDKWPSYFWVSFPSQGGGVKFEAKWRSIYFWTSYTVCITSSTYGVGVGDCAKEFDLPGTSGYTFNVDGPWKVRTQIGSYTNDWTWGFIR